AVTKFAYAGASTSALFKSTREHNVRASALRKRKQRGKAHSKRSAEVTPEGAIICSDENTPLSTRRQRFFMDNCDESVITSASKPTEMDKLRAEVTLLKAEPSQHRYSLNVHRISVRFKVHLLNLVDIHRMFRNVYT
ncbi:PREDICTED: uncharacterized protein LOC105561518, partial [Vollenhovia emeryi]|uniref:uncharacterized protein LOC105561518 n=1 Tax=Vollenhovia emeryi TaxID=411798 RepID=UPI0005F4CACC